MPKKPSQNRTGRISTSKPITSKKVAGQKRKAESPPPAKEHFDVQTKKNKAFRDKIKEYAESEAKSKHDFAKSRSLSFCL